MSDENSGETTDAGLLVYVPSLNWDPATTEDLLTRLEKDGDFADWKIEIFDHKVRTFSRLKMEDVVLNLAAQIRSWSGEDGDVAWPHQIILVGHSLGGILIREALLLDSQPNAPRLRDPQVPQWTERVTRVVLIASPNGGYELQNLARHERAFIAAFSLFGIFLLEHLQEGSEYITHLRLRWFQFMKSRGGNTATKPDIQVVQVVGWDDKLVSREKALDADYIPNATIVDIRDAGHLDIVDLRQAPDPEMRFSHLRAAIRDNLPTFNDVTPENPHPVVFILHGIRSSKSEGWIGALASIIQEPGTDAPEGSADWTEAIPVTPTYGHFGSLHFANPWIRKKNARRLLQWYGEHFIRYSPDNFYFVGHSNGTYMLGKCLTNVPSMRFRRIFLAASVLPKEFKWRRIIDRGQLGHHDENGWHVGAIHSDKGRRDVPVGWLCSILHGLEISLPRKVRMADIGTGGFDGFDDLNRVLMEHRYAGGHGNMLVPVGPKSERTVRMNARLREIADFIKFEAPHIAPETGDAPFFAWVSRILGTATRFTLVILLGAVVAALAFGAPWYFVLGGALIYLLVVFVNQF
ncbi:putative alpha/beta hydrolase family esterase [Arthrobacter sp. V4I6]|uniref:esterase/lipase family protein n=1 Tax=unclassified Arthrobacter TaxID=235627 RepID=UPI00278602F1|nr:MULTISPECIES: hypothetical protein [unclassified Arthrobacter]MDQ0822518.1 putative alpha/beta hydrolase family esterase [Arthrobacter sp. V1I7]MDQ0852145.1 putative alpha/beta hydrolase family esterase [Arthrobacter sp. V4I6]